MLHCPRLPLFARRALSAHALAGLIACGAAAAFAAPERPQQEPVDFDMARGVLEPACGKCHNFRRVGGGLRLDEKELALAGGESGPATVPGDPLKSPLYTTTILPGDADETMPPRREDHLSAEQSEILRRWIADGAKWPDGATLERRLPVAFHQIAAVITESRVQCRHAQIPHGSLRLETRAAAFAGGRSGPGIVPCKAAATALYKVFAEPATHPKVKPSRFKDGALTEDEFAQLRDWIDQGAPWPEGEVLPVRSTKIPATPKPTR